MIGIAGSAAGSLAFYISVHARRTILFTLGLVGFLGLRYAGLREPLYIILLVATLFSLELYLKNQ